MRYLTCTRARVKTCIKELFLQDRTAPMLAALASPCRIKQSHRRRRRIVSGRRHYNYFRDYDPSTGRYAESDPIGLRGGISTFGYVGGNPLINWDPYGQMAWPPDIFSNQFVNSFAAIGDGMTGGLTRWGRHKLGIASVNECSPEYAPSYDFGMGLSTAVLAGGGALGATSRSGLVRVTSWAGEGIAPDLNAGRWAMLGDASAPNYLGTGLWGPSYSAEAGFYSNASSFANSITGEIEASRLSWPSGWEAWKGVLGQRVIGP